MKSAQLLGHEKIWSQLEDSIQAKRLPHSLLFVGPSGVGKKKVALKMAHALLCDQSPKICGVCSNCRQMKEGQHPAMKQLASQGSQIKIDAVREVLKFLSLRSWHAARVVIVDEAHTMNPQAANALLKVVEEPPSNCYFAFVAPSAEQIMATIRSRSQVIRFGGLSVEQLQEATGASGWVLESAQGSAERVFQLSGEENEKLRGQALKSFLKIFGSESSRSITDELAGLAKDKAQFQFLIRLWQQFTRDAVVEKQELQIHKDFSRNWSGIPQLRETSGWNVFQVFQQMLFDIESNGDRQLILESGILKIRNSLTLEGEKSW